MSRVPLKESARQLYEQTFGSSGDFDDLLFDMFFDRCRLLEKDGQVISMFFELPCTLVTKDGEKALRYVYAAATHPLHRGKGHMSRLLEESLRKGPIILRPVDERVACFYDKLGFERLTASGGGRSTPPYIKVEDDYALLCRDEEADSSAFLLMCKGIDPSALDGVCFDYSMP